MADKFIDKVKFFMGFNTYEEDEVLEDEQMEEQPTTAPMIEQRTSSLPMNKVVNLHSTTVSGNMKVVLFQPKEFEDSKQIVDSLKQRKPVIINIEDLDADLARKIFDFCSGALYALDGHIQKVSRGIFILAPNNVDISGDVKSELAEKGIFSWSKNRSNQDQ